MTHTPAWNRLLEDLQFLALNSKGHFCHNSDRGSISWGLASGQGEEPAHHLSWPCTLLSPRDTHNYWPYDKPIAPTTQQLRRMHLCASVFRFGLERIWNKLVFWGSCGYSWLPTLGYTAIIDLGLSTSLVPCVQPDYLCVRCLLGSIQLAATSKPGRVAPLSAGHKARNFDFTLVFWLKQREHAKMASGGPRPAPDLP